MPNKMERFTQRARRILSSAQEEAEHFNHEVIDTEHLLVALIKEDGGIAGRVLRDLGLERWTVEELAYNLSKLGLSKRPKGQPLDLSAHTKKVLELSVDEARRMGHHYIGTEHLLLGLVRVQDCTAVEVLQSLGISPEEIRRQTRRVLQEKPLQAQPSPQQQPSPRKSTPLLDQLSTDLTQLAKQNKLDPVLARDAELEHLLQIMSRRHRNKALLIGKSGIGKTSLVHGLAARIVTGNVPDNFLDYRIIQMDLESIIAGTQYRGSFEDRFKRILQELKQSKTIVFIDDITTHFVTSNLDRIELLLAFTLYDGPFIHACNPKMYEENLKDNFSAQRAFVPVEIQELDNEATIQILQVLRPIYEQHHNLIITDEAIETAVQYASRFIPYRQQPEKSVQLIDDAASLLSFTRAPQSPAMQRLAAAIKEAEDKLKLAPFDEEIESEQYGELQQKLADLQAQYEEASKNWDLENNKARLMPDDIVLSLSKATGRTAEQLKKNLPLDSE